MVWKDPSDPNASAGAAAAPVDASSIPSPAPALSGGSLPPMSSYGAPGQSWNKEMMELLVDIEIPMQYLSGANEKLFIWFKKVLMQIQFGNYTKADQADMIKDLRYIIFLSQQDGNEQIVFEEQLMFISNMMISKGRSDKPDGLRERTMWVMQILKNVFSQEEAKRPDEAGNKLNLPFLGGR